MKTSIYISTLALGTVFAFAAPTPAMAAKTVFHGSTCANAFAPENQQWGGGLAHTAAGLVNTTNFGRIVVCPIDRLFGGAGTLADVEISLTSHNASTNCGVFMTDRYGENGTSTGFVNSHGNGHDFMNFENVGSGPHEGMYYVACQITAGSIIHSIMVEENP